MSDNKRYINIEIGSRNIKLASEENEDYLKAIAKYLNQKMAQITGGDLSNPLYRDDNAILFSLNIADDLFKERTSSGSVAFDTETLAKLESQEKEIAVLNETVTNLTNEKNTLTKDIANKKDEIQVLTVKREDIKNKLDESEKKYASLQGLYANSERQLEEQKREFENLQSLQDKTQLKLEDTEKELSSHKLRLSNSEKRVEEKTNYISKLTAKINDKNQELNALSTKLAEKNSALNELNQKSAERNIKLTNVNKERDDLAVKLKSSNGNIKKLEEEIKELKSAHSKKLSENDITLKAAQEQVTRVQEDYQALLADFENYQAENQTTSENQLQSAFAKTKAENIELKRKIENLSVKLSKK